MVSLSSTVGGGHHPMLQQVTEVCPYISRFYIKGLVKDFPCGTVDRNRPASAGHRGSIPGPGRFHMPQSAEACVPHLLKPTRPRARKLQLLSPCAATTEALAPRARPLQQEKPPRREACAPQLESSPGSPQLEKVHAQRQRPSTMKSKYII